MCMGPEPTQSQRRSRGTQGVEKSGHEAYRPSYFSITGWIKVLCDVGSLSGFFVS